MFAQTQISSQEEDRQKISSSGSTIPPPFPSLLLVLCKQRRLSEPVWFFSVKSIHFSLFLGGTSLNVLDVSFTVRIQAEEYKEKEGQHCRIDRLHPSDRPQKEEGQTRKI